MAYIAPCSLHSVRLDPIVSVAKSDLTDIYHPDDFLICLESNSILDIELRIIVSRRSKAHLGGGGKQDNILMAFCLEDRGWLGGY